MIGLFLPQEPGGVEAAQRRPRPGPGGGEIRLHCGVEHRHLVAPGIEGEVPLPHGMGRGQGQLVPDNAQGPERRLDRELRPPEVGPQAVVEGRGIGLARGLHRQDQMGGPLPAIAPADVHRRLDAGHVVQGQHHGLDVPHADRAFVLQQIGLMLQQVPDAPGADDRRALLGHLNRDLVDIDLDGHEADDSVRHVLLGHHGEGQAIAPVRIEAGDGVAEGLQVRQGHLAAAIGLDQFLDAGVRQDGDALHLHGLQGELRLAGGRVDGGGREPVRPLPAIHGRHRAGDQVAAGLDRAALAGASLARHRLGHGGRQAGERQQQPQKGRQSRTVAQAADHGGDISLPEGARAGMRRQARPLAP